MRFISYKKLKLGPSSEFRNLFPDSTGESYLRGSHGGFNFGFINVMKTNGR